MTIEDVMQLTWRERKATVLEELVFCSRVIRSKSCCVVVRRLREYQFEVTRSLPRVFNILALS